MKKESVLIWLPLPPHAGWRGEGIAQTLENIICNFSQNIHVELLVSPHHSRELLINFKEYPHIHINELSLRGLFFKPRLRSKKSAFKPEMALLKASLSRRNFFKKLINLPKTFWINAKYGLCLLLFTKLQQYKFIFRNSSAVWLPSPTISFSENLSGNIIISFWDPFVFQYSEFKDIAPFLVVKIYELQKKSQLIITQSENNRNFLNQVFKVDEHKIQVIHNGSPDYSQYIHDSVINERGALKDSQIVKFRKAIITSLLGVTFSSGNQSGANKFVIDFLNEAVLNRLYDRVRANSKIFIASTQARPYKGLGILLEVFDRLCKEYPQFDYLLILTCSVPDALRQKYNWFNDRVFEVYRVSNHIHAHLYLISDVVLHPSFAEGGLGAYPQYEAASLGIPALINHGRHAFELSNKFKECEIVISNFSDTHLTTNKIFSLLTSAEARKENIQASRSSRVSWAKSASQYEKLLLSLC